MTKLYFANNVIGIITDYVMHTNWNKTEYIYNLKVDYYLRIHSVQDVFFSDTLIIL